MNDRDAAFSSDGGVNSLYTARIPRIALTTASLAGFAVGAVFAQQVTGVPGSPSATTTISAKQLPPERRSLKGR